MMAKNPQYNKDTIALPLSKKGGIHEEKSNHKNEKRIVKKTKLNSTENPSQPNRCQTSPATLFGRPFNSPTASEYPIINSSADIHGVYDLIRPWSPLNF